ncbi:MAG: polysaccharide biosynthesis/export family protein [Candidatus Azobacteroides sp.]|nr:polysaccharide biosynthesis/export family protein [Candidatus Azobacteroides sp.]
MKHAHFSFYFAATLLILLFSSCGSRRDVVYFQNSDKIPEGISAQDNSEFNAVIMPNDNLFITVSAVNPDAVEVFNTALLNKGGTLSTTTLDVMGYLVDPKGNINFPVVGEVHVAGLTKTEAIQELQKAVSKFVADPVINIRFLNYKISVLGEVNRPGVYTVTDEKISIPQAIALAGDLTIYGERHNVQLIRMEKGEKKFYSIDLTSPDLFFSPDYYLHQNDILYVTPNGTKAGSSTYNQNLPLVVSLISVVITAIALFVRN